MEEEERKSRVKQALCGFLRVHALQDQIENVDDVVLSYVISILEDLGDEASTAEDIDIEQFTEMLHAYIPGFGSISSISVCEWMFDLSAALASRGTTKNSVSPIPDNRSQILARQLSSPSVQREPKSPLTRHSFSDCEDVQVDQAEGGCENEANIDVLLEMFPSACHMEVSHCLALSGGDTDKAAQLILHRQESKDSIVEKDAGIKKQIKMLEDDDLKKKMLLQYSYIDSADDKIDHKPVTPKIVPKKLIRYLDSKVVNTRGERFTDSKKEESDELKKTYINLKPARKYRFH